MATAYVLNNHFLTLSASVDSNPFYEEVFIRLWGRVQSLCSRLEAHEATETERISEAVFTDLGTSG